MAAVSSRRRGSRSSPASRGLRTGRLSPADRRAVEIMRRSLADAAEDGSLAPVGKCEDAQRKDIDYAAMRVALYACFGSLSNSLDFEGQKVTRVGAFDLLTRMNEPERRKKLFMQFVPLWHAINGKSERDSPYRRLIVMAAADARTRGSAIDAAAKTVGATHARSRDTGWSRSWMRGGRRAARSKWSRGTTATSAARPSASSAMRSRARRCSRSTSVTTAISARS